MSEAPSQTKEKNILTGGAGQPDFSTLDVSGGGFPGGQTTDDFAEFYQRLFGG